MERGHFRLGRLAEAATPWREAVRLNPDDPVMHINLALALAKAGAKVKEIVAEYREAIRLQPDFADYHFLLATFLAQDGNVDGAIAEYREAVRIDADRIGASIWALGDLLHKLDRKDEALAVYRRAREIGRDDPAHVAKADQGIAAVERTRALLGRIEAVAKGDVRSRDAATFLLIVKAIEKKKP